MDYKEISSSFSSVSCVMLPSQANPKGNVHGGEIMKLMDTAASVTAMRHAKKNVVTLRVDELIFHEPVYVGNLVTVNSRLTYVGNTSMEIKVEVWVENIEKENSCRLTQQAYFTFVALDDNNKPTKIPKIIPMLHDEINLYKEAEKRYLKRKTQKENRP